MSGVLSVMLDSLRTLWSRPKQAKKATIVYKDGVAYKDGLTLEEYVRVWGIRSAIDWKRPGYASCAWRRPPFNLDE